MTRHRAAGGIPTHENAAYYARRAKADVGLILSEGTWIPHASAGNHMSVPRFYGADALAGWKVVLDAVHDAGGRMMPQLWHAGMVRNPQDMAVLNPGVPSIGPSGLGFEKLGDAAPAKLSRPMSLADVDGVIEAYGIAARSAEQLGFDGIEIHGGHGYLIDQFFWNVTNKRSDRFGGKIRNRSQFAAEIVRECRRTTRSDFPISFRFSQWKVANYGAILVHNPGELEQFLDPLLMAGVDILHCSTRRYWDPAFDRSPLSLAGWTRRISGKPTVIVGSIGLDRIYESRHFEPANYVANSAPLDRLLSMYANDEFDLVAVGRALLVDPNWATKVRAGRGREISPFTPKARDIYY